MSLSALHSAFTAMAKGCRNWSGWALPGSGEG